MAVQAMFSVKDRMSYRYFHKRAHYLAVICASLNKWAAQSDTPMYGVKASWESAMGDERRPIIKLSVGKGALPKSRPQLLTLIVLGQGVKHHLDINLHASIPTDTFPISALYPSRSLVRILTDAETPRSPLYSTSILHDTLHKPHLLNLYRLSQLLPDRTADSFLALWRIWTNRRGIKGHRGGSGWFASMLLGWVVEGGELGGVGDIRNQTRKVRGLGKGLGYWGALRAAWEFLGEYV